MSEQPKKSSFFEKLATFIVDKRNLIFFLYVIAVIASLITQGWVSVCDDLTEYLPATTETRRGLRGTMRRPCHPPPIKPGRTT